MTSSTPSPASAMAQPRPKPLARRADQRRLAANAEIHASLPFRLLFAGARASGGSDLM